MEPSWKSVSIGDLGRVVTGRTPPGARQDYFGESVPFLTPTDMDGRRKVDITARSLSPQGADLLDKVIVPRGVAVSCIGWQMGKAILVDRPTATNQQINTIIPDTSRIHDLFLYYALTAKRHEIFALGAGGSRTPILNKTDFEKIMISVPPLDEQRIIAHILGALDDKIELNRRMNETLEEMARAIFKSWFVDFDPVRAKAEGRDPGLPKHVADLFPNRFEDSELGEIPAGWKPAALSAAIEVNPRRSLKKGEVAPYLDMKNMPTQSARAVDVYDRKFGSGVRFADNDTLVARITPCLENGKTCFVDFLGDGHVGWGSTEYIVLRPKPPLPAEFAYFLARTERFRTYAIYSMCGTSGRQRVPAASLDQFMLAVPAAEVAGAFGKIAQTIMNTMKAKDEESRTLAAIRGALLPRLISGELRVPEAARMAEKALRDPAAL